MALDRTNFHVIGGQTGDAPKICSYTTTDSYATVGGANYFDNLAEVLDVNDIVNVVTSTGTTAVVTVTYVDAISSGAVTIATGVTVTA